MRFVFVLFTACLLAQDPAPSASETRGLPARATPADYQAHADAGKVQVGAEFFQHSVPTPQMMLTTEDFVVVEVGLFGPAGTKVKLSFEDFSLRINAKKNPQPSEPYGLIFKSLKDPEWAPPEAVEEKHSKTGINTGGGGKDPGGSLPPVVHVPIKLQRDWEQRAQKSSFPEGDRQLPQAGLLYFQYRNKAASIHSLELIYSGAGGKATLVLTP
jgi:hypothetical protein